ncbi:sensor histidine kinase [Brevibacillus fluminis]|uniref:sensor histidine kinase n=1 Tax=Brevibacillus fluminis TaxID=511487 RepID=UPI003F897140
MSLQRPLLKSVVSSITMKYILIYCIILVIPVILLYQVIMSNSHRILETNIITNNALGADALAKRFNTELSDVVLQLQLVSNHAKGELDLYSMYTNSREILARSSFVHAIYYLDEQSRIRFELPFMESTSEQIVPYPMFEEARWTQNYTVSDLHKNVRNESVITVAVPVLLESNRFTGVLVAELSREYLSEVLKIHSMSSGGFGYIVDRHGKVIASTDANEWDRDYAGFGYVRNLLIESYGTAREAYQGEASILSYKLLKDGWGVIIGVPERIAFEPVVRQSRLLTLSFIGILLFSLCLIGLGMRYLLSPVVRLTHLAQNYTVEASLREISRLKRYHSSDELGLLMRTFIRVGVSNLEKQRMLTEKEQYLRNIIEGIPFAIVTLDNNGVITYFNRQFEKLTGISAQQGIGINWADLSINQAQDERIVIDFHSTDSSHETESTLVDVQGNKHMIKVIMTRFINERGDIAGILIVLHDVSQQKLLEAYAKQREKLASIGQITAGIAHEIKNPLAILSGASELLKEEVQEKQYVDQMIRELTDDIFQVVGRMNGIANDFLQFTKNSNDEWEAVSLDELLDKVLHLLRIKLKECNIRVCKEEQAEYPVIMGKKDKLMQVFLNIVLNSIDAMPNGGSLTIQWQRELQENVEWIVVVIRDTGEGISANQLEWLFNPFFTTKENGSGLGLTIARDIVIEHKGCMSIESREAEGTIVWCKFPKNSHGGGNGHVNTTHGLDY